MRSRLLALVCGIVLGLLLRGAVVNGDPVTPAASSRTQSAARSDPRCATHPVKMPCLFDTVSAGK
jgi:hypothetical protein